MLSEQPESKMEGAKTKEVRKVGPGLLLGIALVPIVFVWFLLRSGHTTLARVSGFAWLALSIFLASMVDEVPSASSTKVERPDDSSGMRTEVTASQSNSARSTPR